MYNDITNHGIGPYRHELFLKTSGIGFGSMLGNRGYFFPFSSGIVTTLLIPEWWKNLQPVITCFTGVILILAFSV